MSDTITLSRAEYEALLDRLEDAEDRAAVAAHEAELRERGAPALHARALPLDAVRSLVAGTHPVKVWRQYRGLNGSALARAANVPQSYLSEIERDVKPGSVETLAKLAEALDVLIDDLVRPTRVGAAD